VPELTSRMPMRSARSVRCGAEFAAAKVPTIAQALLGAQRGA
jgi:hypothetical protein